MTTTLQSNDPVVRRVKKAKISLMRNPKFALWSGIMMVGKTEVIAGFPTAATNGRDEMYGAEFVDTLTDKELMFVILHENLHKAFRHLVIWKKLHDEDARLANMACDYVINLILHDTDPNEQLIAMPRRDGKKIGLLDEKYRGLNTKQVFDLLKQEQSEDSDGSPDGDGFDDHDWEGAQNLDKEEAEQLERDIDQALRQGKMTDEKLNGKGKGNMPRELGELLEPKVDWREVLREFVSSVCSGKDTSSWRRVNRRFIGNGTYLPTLISEKVGHIAIGIDTSGSIMGEELSLFLSEVKAIAENVHPEKVDLIYWGHEVEAHEQYDISTVPNLINSTKPVGGGGTDPQCMMRFLKDEAIKPECIIMLTDGYVGNWGNEWEAPLLWVCSTESITAPVGKTVHLN